MGQQDVYMVQYTLECNKAMHEGKTRPNTCLRRPPVRPELKINNPAWSMLLPVLKSAWAREKTEDKEKVIAQFNVPITKNRQLTAYQSTSHKTNMILITQPIHKTLKERLS